MPPSASECLLVERFEAFEANVAIEMRCPANTVQTRCRTDALGNKVPNK